MTVSCLESMEMAQASSFCERDKPGLKVCATAAFAGSVQPAELIQSYTDGMVRKVSGRLGVRMSGYGATIVWKRNGARFLDNRYSRAHVWQFDGGVEVNASSSPQVVPLPMSSENAVDPEEAFVASLSSCHMLWFLSLAARSGFVVESYQDCATGTLAPNAQGKPAITEVTLRPTVEFAGDRRPGPAEITTLHDRAHENCFIANSVRTNLRCEPQL